MSKTLSTSASRRRPAVAWFLLALVAGGASLAQAQFPASAPIPASPAATAAPSIIHKVQSANDRLEMTIHSSRLLTLDLKVPRAQVNNPDLLDLTPVSAKQVQIYAKKAGVTQVNLWDEDGEIHSIDVVVFGDVRELAMTLQAQFPNSSIKVFPTATSVLLSGYVDRPDYISKIVRMAEDYYPKVINNITVGGAQQVLLHVKVMEVSRTKLRQLGFDFAQFSSSDFVNSGIGGVITKATSTTPINRTSSSFSTTGKETMSFGVIDQNASFFEFISALQQNELIKTLAEPTLVTVSGRPAYFLAGGQLPYPIPSGLGTTSIAFKDYGTQIDFVPVILGNGNVRLEVRPSVSAIDNSVAITINGSTVPGFTTRTVDTGVELKVGQTLALAGLIQSRLESTKSQIPWFGDVPLFGTLFRNVQETLNEVELLIMVRPELAEGIDCEDAPPLGPGQNSEYPNDCQLYLNGYQEVPLPATPQVPPGGFGPPVQPPAAQPGQPGAPGSQPGNPGAPIESVPLGRPVVQPSSSDLPPFNSGAAAGSRPPVTNMASRGDTRVRRPVSTGGTGPGANGNNSYTSSRQNPRLPSPKNSAAKTRPGLSAQRAMT